MKLKELIENFIPTEISFRKPFIIAEAGVNHEGKIELAKRLIAEAKEGGADAIKFQTYKAEKIASKNSPSYWDLTKEPTESQYMLFKKYDKFWKNEFEELKAECDKYDIEFLSTPFDTESTVFLNELVDVFKISSSDITNKPFIEFICGFNKPIILSTGASYIDEIKDANNWILENGNKLALMHCILNYPTDDSDANLGMIKDLQRVFPGQLIGYSDHTLPNDMMTLQTAFLLGALVLEKHFTFDKTLPGNDHYHAMDKNDLKLFINNINRIKLLIGNSKKISLESEEPARNNARRSLVAARKIPQGKIIELNDITWKRPALGIPPFLIDKIVGQKAVINIEEDTILNWSMLID